MSVYKIKRVHKSDVSTPSPEKDFLAQDYPDALFSETKKGYQEISEPVIDETPGTPDLLFPVDPEGVSPETDTPAAKLPEDFIPDTLLDVYPARKRTRPYEAPPAPVETSDEAVETPDEAVETSDEATETPDEAAETPDEAVETSDEAAETPDEAAKTPNEAEEPLEKEKTEEMIEASFETDAEEQRGTDGREDLTRALALEMDEEKRLLEELRPEEVDFTKIGAVFGAGANVQNDEKLSSLLEEVFGEEDTKKKKKKKASEDTAELTSTAQIHGIFADKAAEPLSGDLPQPESDNEKTKVFPGSIASALENIRPEEEPTRAVPEVNAELEPDHENPYSDTYDELEEEKTGKIRILPEEYVSREDYDLFAETMRNRNFSCLSKAIIAFFMFLVVLYMESATFSGLYHPDFLKPGETWGIIFLLVDLQLVFISALFQLRTVAQGAKLLFTGKADRHSLGFLSTLFAVIHIILLIIFPVEGYALFGSVAAFLLFLNAIADFLDAKRLYRTFRITAAAGEKFVAEEVAENSTEREALGEKAKNAKIFTVAKTNFIEDFFRRTREENRAGKSFTVAILLSILLSAAFAGFIYYKTPETMDAVGAFMAMFAMTLPLSGVFTVSLPFAHISKKAEKRDAAISSAIAAEKYASADVVSFTDKEIFPSRFVKVTTIRTYGDTAIDKAILYAAMIFQKLGGPLSEVFKKTISGMYESIPENFDFLEITADGLCAKIDEKDVFVGNKDYMLSYDFGYIKDEGDEDFESRSGKIMYMVIGTELAGKFYIKYAISSRFRKTIGSLFKAGICPAVKTCDPNVNEDLFKALLKNAKIPAGIIKTTDAMKDAPVADTSTSGIVCTSSIANILHAFILCDSLRHLIRTNILIKILTVLVGAGVVLFMYFTENVTQVNTVFALLYQILWLIPVFLPSVTE